MSNSFFVVVNHVRMIRCYSTFDDERVISFEKSNVDCKSNELLYVRFVVEIQNRFENIIRISRIDRKKTTKIFEIVLIVFDKYNMHIDLRFIDKCFDYSTIFEVNVSFYDDQRIFIQSNENVKV